MKFLLLNQTFHPDVVATAQYLSEVAVGLVERGHAVSVISSRRGYDSADREFPVRERWKGIEIRRVRSTWFGKKAPWRRALDFASFLAGCCWELLRSPRPDVVVALTSPPLISFVAAVHAALRRCDFVYWVMDLNPDEAIAAGWLRERSPAARMLGWMSRFSFRRARSVVVLDRFMKKRVLEAGAAGAKVVVLPPWSQDETVRFDPPGRAEFRSRHGLSNKFVVMHSGNHSPCHPLETILKAARELALMDRRICFCFVGGGSEIGNVKKFAAAHALENIICLPYQPLSSLAASLSAADLHVTVMGDPFVGMIHPCKIYNILRVGVPLLYVGPVESHVTDILAQLDGSQRSFSIRHGDAVGAVHAIQVAAAAAAARTGRSGVAAEQFRKKRLLGRLLDVLDGNDTPKAPLCPSFPRRSPARGWV